MHAGWHGNKLSAAANLVVLAFAIMQRACPNRGKLRRGADSVHLALAVRRRRGVFCLPLRVRALRVRAAHAIARARRQRMFVLMILVALRHSLAAVRTHRILIVGDAIASTARSATPRSSKLACSAVRTLRCSVAVRLELPLRARKARTSIGIAAWGVVLASRTSGVACVTRRHARRCLKLPIGTRSTVLVTQGVAKTTSDASAASRCALAALVLTRPAHCALAITRAAAACRVLPPPTNVVAVFAICLPLGILEATRTASKAVRLAAPMVVLALGALFAYVLTGRRLDVASATVFAVTRYTATATCVLLTGRAVRSSSTCRAARLSCDWLKAARRTCVTGY